MYKGAIIGFGGVAEVHARAYKNVPELQIVAVADVTPERLQTARNSYGFSQDHLYSNFKEMMSKEKLDFVDICSPYLYHKEIAIAACEQGLNVLCEKPLASNLADIDEMTIAAQKNHVKLMVCHNWSYLPFIQKAKDLVDSNDLNDPYFLEYFLAKEEIVWRGSAKEYLPEWRTKVEYGGGPILDEAPHIEYLSKWLLGSEVRSIKATIDNLSHQNYAVEDFGVILNRYHNGATSLFCMNFFSSESKWSVGIQGRNASITLPSPVSKTYQVDPIFLVCKDSTKEIGAQEGKPRSFKEDYVFSMEGVFQDFIAAVQGHKIDHPVSATDGRRAVEAILASYESAALEKEISVPLSPTDPVYRKGVFGLKDLQIPRENCFYQKNLFHVKQQVN